MAHNVTVSAEDGRRRTGSISGMGARLSRIRLERLLAIVSPVVVLGLWEAFARTGRINALFFPPPTLVFRTIFAMTLSGELPLEVGVSLRRVLIGFAIGGGPAVALGLAMGWSRRLRVLVDPLIAATYPIPKITLLPMIMLIFGVGEASKIVIVAVGTFYPAAINAIAGVLGISPTYFEVARNFGASRWKTFTRVVLPGSLPIVFTGLRLAFGVALLLVVASEFVSAREGIGAMIWLSWQTLRTEKLYAGIMAWAVVGLLSTMALQVVERRLIRWIP